MLKGKPVGPLQGKLLFQIQGHIYYQPLSVSRCYLHTVGENKRIKESEENSINALDSKQP